MFRFCKNKNLVWSRWASSFSLVVVLVLAIPGAKAESLAEVKQRLGINANPEQVTVSGISSGGWQAVQYHIAHSNSIAGVGVLAAGPYHCAGGSSFYCEASRWLMPADTCRAIYQCSNTAEQQGLINSANRWFYNWVLSTPDYKDSVETTLKEAKAGNIDPITGLVGDRVWLFTGGKETIEPHDSMVPASIVNELKEYYAAIMTEAGVDQTDQAIVFEDSIQVEHSMVVDSPTEDNCANFGLPFINDCSYPAAEKILAHLYPERGLQNAEELGGIEVFEQGAVSTDAATSMHEEGHVYVPSACRDGQSCPVHVALHGCAQDQTIIGSLPADQQKFFYQEGGYNQWAEDHGILVLYPQAKASSADPLNPFGCWDWWGYSGEDYYLQSAKQITAIHSMVGCLTGEAECSNN